MGWLRDTFGRRGGSAAPAHDKGELLAQGAAQLERGEYAAAADTLEQVLARRGDGVPAGQLHYLLGRAYAGMGRFAPASMNFEAALRAQPEFAEALEEGARVLQELEELDEAVEWLQRLVNLRPTVGTRLQLARGLRRADRLSEAAGVLGPLCAGAPRNIDAAVLHHYVLVALGRFEEAIAEIDRAIGAAKLDVANVQHLVDLASACHRLARHEEAAALVDQALQREPGHAAALNLHVVGLALDLQLAAAEAAARKALDTHPNDADLHWILAIALLLQGKLGEGWREHRWRWRASAMATSAPVRRPEPPWHGESLAGRSVLLVSEQGLGDAIQFLRFVPAVARSAGRVLLQAHPKLHGLLADLPPNCEVLSPSAPVHADLHCALMDLPDCLGVAMEDLGRAVPYLRADPARAAQWAPRVRDGSRRLHVGLAWSGNPAHPHDRQRSIPLERFASVLGADARFVSVQTDLRASDQPAADALPLALGPARELADFGDTAALLASLDLVITVDSSVAHLAGALGRPVWILLPYCPDWRWMVGRPDSPWYPTARLFRQPRRGDWDSVLQNVGMELDRLIDAQ